MSGTSFHADYGGPAVTVPRLAQALAAHGLSIALWAPDGSAKSISKNCTNPLIEYRVGKLSDALREGGLPDIMHDNGIWLPHNHAIARASRELGIPRLVSPRGMLEPWSLSHRALKKRIAWFLYQRRDLNSAVILHCTAVNEAKNVARLGLTPKCVVVPNGVDLPPRANISTCDSGLVDKLLDKGSTQDNRRMLFLSRVHPKKGIPLLLEAWANITPAGWELLIAGPPEEGHDKDVLEQVNRLGLSRAVEYIGPVYGDRKHALMLSADVFVLPTHSENFGMVIAEALSLGKPVLTTTGAPWEILLREKCGWWVEPTVSGIRDGLLAAISASDAERRAMGARGRLLVKEQFSWEKVGAEMKLVYGKILSMRHAHPGTNI